MAPPMNDGDQGPRRSRRDKRSSTGAKKALEEIRKYQQTGERAEYQIGNQESLYDIVDEREYERLVRKRQAADWIVDDDGSGYFDDGREIFDDDQAEEPEEYPKDKSSHQEKAKPKINSQKITNLFMAKSRKKKEEDVSVTNDNVLEDILQSITTSKPHEKSLERKKSVHKTPKRTSLDRNAFPRRLQDEDEPSTSQRRRVTKFRVSKDRLSKGSVAPELVVKKEDPVVDNDYDQEDFALESDELVTNANGNNLIKTEKQDEVKEEMDLNGSFDLGNDIEIPEIEKESKNQLREEVEDNSEDQGVHVTWEEILERNKCETVEDEEFTNVTIDSSILPLTEVNGESVLRFFMLDAYEDTYHQPGTVYLFGKVSVDSAKSHVSCCVTVKNIERRLLILPRRKKLDKAGNETNHEVTMKDVYEEFNDIATKMKIMNFKCKPTTMKYAFEMPNIPTESEYLEVLYPADQPPIPKDKKGQTFSHIFGTNTSSLEHLLIGRKLKGPSWIEIKYPQVPKQSVSWCKIEALVTKPDYISTAVEQGEIPALTILSIAICTIRNSKTHAHEVLGVSGLIHNKFYLDKAAPKNKFDHCFTMVTKPTEHLLPYDFQKVIKTEKRQIQAFSSERSILGLLLAKIQTIDPDIIVGHDVIGFDFDVLLHRINANKVPHWSKIGRLKRQTPPKLSGTHGSRGSPFIDRNIACGRLICDTKISAKELIRCKSYDLTELTSVVLNKMVRSEVDMDDIPKKLGNSRELLKLLDLTTMDALYNISIVFELNALPLAYQITGICGNVLSRTLQGGRSERNEFLLLHAFAKEGYICPDKSYSKKSEAHFDDEGEETKKGKSRRKPQYAGGLVLEPKKGFYDKFILLLDFNSLYPSIIQEYNICFTTVNRTSCQDDDDELPEMPDPSLPPGVLPTEIRKLVERRRQVKGMMKTVNRESDMYLQYDIRQKALKLTANSMYGCLGFSNSRFHAKPLAAMVTMRGREILMKTKDLVQALNLEVIYGDTDSIMINTNSIDFDEVFKIGNKVKSEVNKLYKLLEIDIDGIYKSMLLLKKKKYAAIAVQKLDDGQIIQTKELKGLDIVRRDWCELAKQTGEFTINQILSCQSCDALIENIHEYLFKVREDVEENKVPSRKFEISKGLAKAPDEYPDKKSLPHVTVAQRLMSQGKRVAVGDTIQYIICDDGSNLPATQRAYHPDEFAKNKSLKIDTKYYLANQIHPVISRLCDPIEGTSSVLIAECLGLDPSQYTAATLHRSQEEDTIVGRALLSDEERFKDVEKFEIFCKNPQCNAFKQNTVFEGELLSTNKVSWACSECKTNYDENLIMNKLTIFVRRLINQYYKGILYCDDPVCGVSTRLVRLRDGSESQSCDACKIGYLRQIYSEGQLYNQLFYLQRVFCGDPNKTTSKNQRNKFAKKMESILQNDGFSTVVLSDLFTFDAGKQ